MSFTAIASSAVTAGKAVTQTLMDLIRTNFDDHESRIVSLEAATIVNGFIVGEIRVWTNASLPSGFLWCDGSAVSRTTYADLFATVGTTFGIGDGSTTFNVPDLRGRVPVGKDDMGGSGASRVTSGGSGITGTTLGATGGTETHTLITAEIPTHNHTITDSGHTHTLTDPGHVHNLLDSGAGASSLNYISPVGVSGGQTAKGDMVQSATTGITMSTDATGISLATAGSDGAHLNMQPSMILNMIIRYQGS